MVDAAAAREHLLLLRRRGVGRRAVADATDLNYCTVFLISSGRRTQIRKLTAERILAVGVTARADHALVDAAGAWVKIRALLRRGYTKKQLAAWMGCKAKVPSLQLRKDRITARSASKVDRLCRMLDEGRLERPSAARWRHNDAEMRSWGVGTRERTAA